MNKIKVLELFGGIGAATQALKRISKEVEIIDYVELDKHAVNSYNAMNGTNFVPTDINNIDMKKYPEVDVLIAGWPCQDYSVAGKGLGLEGTRSNLILLTISKIKEMINKPKYILLENVKGILGKKHKQDLEYIKELFSELGYQWNQALLNSKYFGVPQSRERVFMLLTRNDLKQVKIDHLEQRNKVETILADILDFTEPTQTIKLIKENHLKFSNFITLPRASDGKLINGFHNRFWSYEKYSGTITASATPRIYYPYEKNDKIVELNVNKLKNQNPTGINQVGVLGKPQNDDFKTSNFGAKDRFYGIKGINATATSTDIGRSKVLYDEGMIIHYRKLSTLECWRLMGFSDEAHNKIKSLTYLTKNGKEKRLISDSQLAKQAGNSIVVNVLVEIFKELFKETKNTISSKKWLELANW